MFLKFITNYIEQGWWHSSLTLQMQAFPEQKRKACIQFTRMNLFTKWYCNGNTLPHNWNFWGCCEAEGCHLVVQCNLFMIFQSTVIRVCYQNKFPRLLMQHDWFMYHLRSYKNFSPLDSPPPPPAHRTHDFLHPIYHVTYCMHVHGKTNLTRSHDDLILIFTPTYNRSRR